MVVAERWPWRRQFRALVFSMFFLILFFCLYIPSFRARPVKEVTGWGYSVTRDTRVYVLPGNSTSILGCQGCCVAASGDRGLLIVVTSAPNHGDRRAAIRATWAARPPTGIAVAFLLGLTENSTEQMEIEEESSKFGDIVQEGFIDSYNNLTIKSVMMLKWFITTCKEPTFLMKTDDDMFVNMTRLTAVIGGANTTGTLIGYLISEAHPIQDHSNKWYSPRYMYSHSVYPNYLSGTGYVMSRDVATLIYKTALYTPLFHLEDVYITGICRMGTGIKAKHHPAFTLQLLEVGCYPDLATVHGFSSHQLTAAWANRHECSQPPNTVAAKAG